MSKAELSGPITLRLPADLLKQVEAIAAASERSRSWVIVRALRLYIAGEGDEILAVSRGRGQIASGDAHDVDDVLRDVEAIVAGKAA
ncbi:CopG family ribbon-helix-helix protein [Mangrovicella endophytica]|uniref:CopG family ribbon-helix-helix protein n=1 Tax=Mangrovicella endophytica TaxID=2066697 RepID=UPI000C9EB208